MQTALPWGGPLAYHRSCVEVERPLACMARPRVASLFEEAGARRIQFERCAASAGTDGGLQVQLCRIRIPIGQAATGTARDERTVNRRGRDFSFRLVFDSIAIARPICEIG